MAGCAHTEFRKGQKVILLMKDGSKVIGKYLENKSGVVILKDRGRVKTAKIRQISIYRGV